MKIDFNAPFEQVARLINARPKEIQGERSKQEFGNALAALSPQAMQHIEIIKEMPGAAVPAPLAENNLAAYLGVESQQLRPPEFIPMEIPDITVPLVKGEALSVKTPALPESIPILPELPDPVENIPKTEVEIQKLVGNHSREQGVDPALSLAVASAESSFRTDAVSSDGHASKGIFQLLDRTGKELLERAGLPANYDPFNPQQNITLGVQYLRRLHETFSSEQNLPNDLNTTAAENSASLEKLAVAAFNAGEGRVASAQARARLQGLNPGLYENIESYLPDSTKEYVSRVMTLKTQFELAPIGTDGEEL